MKERGEERGGGLMSGTKCEDGCSFLGKILDTFMVP